jgi:hypothetical protein
MIGIRRVFTVGLKLIYPEPGEPTPALMCALVVDLRVACAVCVALLIAGALWAVRT